MREVWEYSGLTERTVRDHPAPVGACTPPIGCPCGCFYPSHRVFIPHLPLPQYAMAQVRDYRAKFSSLFSALERRGRDDDGKQLTVAEALPDMGAGGLMGGLADDAGWGPKMGAKQPDAAAAKDVPKKASRLQELLEWLDACGGNGP